MYKCDCKGAKIVVDSEICPHCGYYAQLCNDDYKEHWLKNKPSNAAQYHEQRAKRLEEEKIQLLRPYLKRCLKKSQIAKEIGVSYSTLTEWFYKYPVLGSLETKYKMEAAGVLKKRYDSGVNYTALAECSNFSRHQLPRLFEQYEAWSEQ